MGTYLRKFSSFFIVVIFSLCLINATASFGATICVPDDMDLQSALNTAADNGEDDIIRVVQGTYTGNFTYTASSTENFDLTLQGGFTSDCSSREVDPSNTVLDGGGTGRVLTFLTIVGNTGASATVDGFTIQNGNVFDPLSGGGIFASLPGPITLTHNDISNNTAQYAGGVYTKGSSTTFTNNTITNNTASFRAGGVYAEGSPTTFTNNIITNNANYGEFAGGVYAYGGSTFTNNTISNNTASGGGGGVVADSRGSSTTFTNNTISNNTASWGGGVTAYYGPITFTNNTITNNTASFRAGGGVYADEGSITFINNTISNNTASDDGGGVYAEGDSTFTNNIITGNSSKYGGGVFAWRTIIITNNTIAYNSTTATIPSGGGLYIYLYSDLSTASIYNNIIYGNIRVGATIPDDVFNNPDADNNGIISIVNICYNDFTSLSGFLAVNTGVGCQDVPNSGNIDADPLFVNPGAGDFHLQDGSPCINIGYNSAPSIPSEDKDGFPRIMDAAVDMGAYESIGEVPTTTTTETTTSTTTTTTTTTSTTTSSTTTTTTTTTSTTTTTTTSTTTTTFVCWCPADSSGGCVSGQVTDSEGEPLVGKTVRFKGRLFPGGPRFDIKTRTDDNGCYKFTLPEGIGKIWVKKCRGGGRKEVSVPFGGKVNDVNFECKKRRR